MSEGQSEVVASAEGMEEASKRRPVGTEEVPKGQSVVVAPAAGTEEASEGWSEVVASAVGTEEVPKE